MASEERAGWVDWSFAGGADGGNGEAGEAGGVVGGLVLAEVGSSDVGIADDVDALDTLEIGEHVELLKRRPRMLDRRDHDESISLMRFGKPMISEKKRETGVFEIGLTFFPWSIATATMCGKVSITANLACIERWVLEFRGSPSAPAFFNCHVVFICSKPQWGHAKIIFSVDFKTFSCDEECYQFFVTIL